MNLTLRTRDTVKPCPFCGSRDVELCNTHTATYWLECQGCGAEVSGKAYGTNTPSEKQTPRQHRLAVVSALVAWNRRAAFNQAAE